MKKKIIYIGLEFLFGPIQKFEKGEDGKEITGVKAVDDDHLVQLLDEEINALWCSLYFKNDDNSSGFDFDYEKEKSIAPRLLELVNKLLNRLLEINDGSYEIKDMATKHLKRIIGESSQPSGEHL